MKKRAATAEHLADEILSLFEGRDTWQLVMSDGLADGCDGVRGLRLVANCLYEQFAKAAGTQGLRRYLSVMPANARLEKVKKALKRLSRQAGAWFVLCYRLQGGGEWCMAWSEQLGPTDAFQVMIEYVRCGMVVEAD